MYTVGKTKRPNGRPKTVSTKKVKGVRKPCYLPGAMAKKASKRAKDLGVSWAEYIRGLISHDLSQEAQQNG